MCSILLALIDHAGHLSSLSNLQYVKTLYPSYFFITYRKVLLKIRGLLSLLVSKAFGLKKAFKSEPTIFVFSRQ